MNAVLETDRRPPIQWAVLREWAKVKEHPLAAPLVKMLDAFEDLRERHPALASECWKTCRMLADKIAGVT